MELFYLLPFLFRLNYFCVETYQKIVNFARCSYRMQLNAEGNIASEIVIKLLKNISQKWIAAQVNGSFLLRYFSSFQIVTVENRLLMIVIWGEIGAETSVQSSKAYFLHSLLTVEEFSSCFNAYNFVSWMGIRFNIGRNFTFIAIFSVVCLFRLRRPEIGRLWAK